MVSCRASQDVNYGRPSRICENEDHYVLGMFDTHFPMMSIKQHYWRFFSHDVYLCCQ